MDIVSLAIAFFIGVLIGHLIRVALKLVMMGVVLFIVLVMLGYVSLSLNFGLIWDVFRLLSSFFSVGGGVVGLLAGFGTPMIIGVIIGFLLWH
jgi:hypothetical protein